MKKVSALIVILLLQSMVVYAITVSDFLVDADIGQFSKSYPGACPKGTGIVAGTGHFKIDHADYACDIRYYNEGLDFGVNVQVTKHSGGDSDKWLGHELDAAFRDEYGIPSKAYTPRLIDGQTIMVDAVGGRNYRWVSGSKVIMIEYHGSLRTLPEPTEVVNAYLAKHPSSLPAMTLAQLRSTDSKTKWIKDEMDRRLWLCDKWFMQLQLQKVDEKQTYQEAVKSMNVFLDYREKYYGTKASDEKNLLAGYRAQNNGTGIKAKLAEYKTWWSVNKGKGINL